MGFPDLILEINRLEGVHLKQTQVEWVMMTATASTCSALRNTPFRSSRAATSECRSRLQSRHGPGQIFLRYGVHRFIDGEIVDARIGGMLRYCEVRVVSARSSGKSDVRSALATAPAFGLQAASTKEPCVASKDPLTPPFALRNVS
jgi:hypothetical protein